MLCLLLDVAAISILLAAAVLIIALVRSDGDLLLMLAANFGKSPGEYLVR